MVFSILAAAVAISAVFSFLESKAALTKLANRHLAYKAEQLRDFINNEWQTLDELRLSDQDAFRTALERSFNSYAYSLLRGNGERFFVFDALGALLFDIGAAPMPTASLKDAAAEPILLSGGWFERRMFDAERVGIAFAFEPFSWTIAVSESRENYFSDVERILRTHLWIFVGSLVGATGLALLYLRYILGPLERLTRTIDHIEETGSLSFRAQEESLDEIGVLARRFNKMIATIEVQRNEISDRYQAEKEAKETVVQREEETLALLARVSDYNDETTGAHVARIAFLSERLAEALGKSEDYRELIGKSSPLHDIGKIAVPQHLLQKPGKLTPEEFEAMRKHTTYGYELLKGSQSRYLIEGAMIALTHHERWDGTGYPAGSAKLEIPLSGRIVGIVDVYDALTSDRPYKKAWSKEDALAYIVGQREKHFDPELVDIFEAYFKSFAAI